MANQQVSERDGRLTTRYALDGTPLAEDESLSFYAALLPGLRRHAPEVASTALEPRLDAEALGRLMAARDRYYDHNWVWLGLALDRGLIAARTPAPPG